MEIFSDSEFTEFFEVLKHFPDYDPIVSHPLSSLLNEKFEVRDMHYNENTGLLILATSSGFEPVSMIKNLVSFGNSHKENSSIEAYLIKDSPDGGKKFELVAKIEPESPGKCLDFHEGSKFVSVGLENGSVVLYRLENSKDGGFEFKEAHKCPSISKTGISRIALDTSKKIFYSISSGKKFRTVSYDPFKILQGRNM